MVNHNHSHSKLQNKFRLAVFLTSAVLIAEVIGGLLTNSLALISDAAHVFADVFALALSWVALHLSTLPPSNNKTYGYHRAEVFAAFINGVSLIVIAGWIFYSAIKRLSEPEPVKSLQMLIIAIIGLFINLIVALILISHSHDNLNVKSAFFHVLGDAISSAGVIIGGIIMKLTNWFLIDPILSFGIGAIILSGASKITRDAIHILLEGTPANINIDDVSNEIKKLNFIKDVHDLHIWSIKSDYTALSAHILVDAQSIKTIQNALSAINKLLKDKFNISHTTIQFECGERACMNSLLCNFYDHPQDIHSDET